MFADAPYSPPEPLPPMLNALRLSELLAKNADPKLYPRLIVMSPNGTLMAYSTPVDIKELRDQAALISMAWKEHDPNRKSHEPSSRSRGKESVAVKAAKPLETLTIETQHNNIIIRALQPNLLLVLVGTVPPFRKDIFKINAETKSDPRYPSADLASLSTSPNPTGPSNNQSANLAPEPQAKPPSIRSTLSQRESDIKLGPLHIQRKKIDALTDYIRREFDEKGFVMPDDTSFA